MKSRLRKGIVILGHPRSGTTLTRRLLNGHSKIASPPETHLLGACGRFLEAERTAFGIDIGVLSGLSFAGISDEEVLNKLREFAFSFLDNYAAKEGKTRWAEKTAFDAFHMRDIEQLCGDHVYYVGVVRHPLDVAKSSAKFCESMGFYPKDMHKYISKHSHPIEAFAHSWLDVSRDLIELNERQSDNCKIFRYEDLVGNSEETLRELLSFVGESFEETILEQGLSRDQRIGFGDHKSYQTRKIHDQSIGKWRELPEYQLQTLAPLINPMLERLGYPIIVTNREISVADARRHYSRGLELVAERRIDHAIAPPRRSLQEDDKVYDAPSIRKLTVYGNRSDKRAETHITEKWIPDDLLAQHIRHRVEEPEYFFISVLSTLFLRISEDNKLTLGFRRPECDEDEVWPVRLAPIHGASLMTLLRSLKATIETTDIGSVSANTVESDILLDYYNDIDIYEKDINELSSLLERRSGFLENPNHALCLKVLDDREKGTFELAFTFSDELWQSEKARKRTIGHFEIILRKFIDNPDQRIDGFSLLTNEEADLLDTAQGFDEIPASVIQKFMTQVEERSAHTAVLFEGESISYRELGRRVSVLSELLRSKGVTKNKIVAIGLDPSINLVTALLAVMHAGGTYVPLDPEHPRSRISQILEDADPQFLLTDAQRRESLETIVKGKVHILEDTLWDTDSEIRYESYEPGDLAYVIFTSGSTGRPKGVEVYHRGLSTFLAAMAETPGMSRDDRLLSVTTVSFDIAALELFLPLVLGATLYIATRADTRDGAALKRLLAENRITIFQATPATFHILLASNWEGDSSLKLLCGGEAMSPELAAKLLPKCRSLWNMYGPTETTIWSTVKHVQQAQAIIPIGRAIRGTRTYVLNEAGFHVPIGVPGELYIAGEGVAKGYFANEALTRDRFLPEYNSPDSASKMYRTGDLVRTLGDGDLVYLGRLDSQVKIRGYRIELGDIEAAINKKHGVKQCVVDVHQTSSGARSLVAYIVPEVMEPKEDIVALSNYLRSFVPEYMIPNFVVYMDKLPLTPNNKVDRKSLPAPRTEDDQTDARENDIVFSSDKVLLNVDPNVARKIAQSWGAILNIQNIKPSDSFATLGGDSLNFVQASMQLEGIIGRIPEGWEIKTINDLSTASNKDNYTIDMGDMSIFSTLDVTIFVRSIAILSIVFLHTFSDWGLVGGTSGLFLVSGFLFAKFQFKRILEAGNALPVIISAWNILLPSTLTMGLLLYFSGDMRYDVLLLYSNFGENTGFLISAYWFIQVLMQILFVMAITFTIKPILQYAGRNPYKFGQKMLLASFVFMLITPALPIAKYPPHWQPQVHLWEFVVGWCIYFANTKLARIYTIHVLAFIAIVQFSILGHKGDLMTLTYPTMTVVFGALILFNREVIIIKALRPLFYGLASSSLYIYLVHIPLLGLCLLLFPQYPVFAGFIGIVVSLFAGYVFGVFWDFFTNTVKGLSSGLIARR